MAQQQLDGTQVSARLQQVYGEGVPQRMRRNRFADPALRPHLATGAVDGERMHRPVGSVTREQPCAGPSALPIVAQQFEQSGRQHHIAVFATLTLLDPDDHAPAVDGVGLEADGFGDSQTGRVTDSQDHAVLQIVHSGKEARHLVLAHHHGQLLGLLASRDVVLNNPRTLEGDGVEEPQG